MQVCHKGRPVPASARSVVAHNVVIRTRTLLVAGLVCLCSLFLTASAHAGLTTSAEIDGLKAQFIDVNGVRTRYYEMGQGEPMVLVHGGGWSGYDSANIWSKDIARLAKQFQVLAPDKLGSGLTDNPTDDNDFNIQGEVDHIYDFIRVKKLDTVHLVGEGSGGACVLFLALQHPEIVRDLAIIASDTAAPDVGLASKPAWKCKMQADVMAPDTVFDEDYLLAAKYMGSLPKSQQSATKRKAGAGGDLATEKGFDRWKMQWYQRIRNEGVLQMPVLIYWGETDPSTTATEAAALRDLIAAKNQKVRLITVAAGHFPFREKPQQFVDDLSSFIVSWRDSSAPR